MKFFHPDRYVVRFDRRRLPDGCHYMIPLASRHRPACQALLKGALFEPRTHRLVSEVMAVRSGHILHAGTFYGDMLPSFSRACGPEHRLYAFEPLLENYVLARGTVDQNGLDNVVLVSAALGEEVGPCKMRNTLKGNPDRHAGGAAGVDEAGESTAAMLTIDMLALEGLSLIHLDVEGFEKPALSGGKETIRRCRPAVFIEDNARSCTELLGGLGYVYLGETPALRLWAPEEDRALRDRITGSGIMTKAA